MRLLPLAMVMWAVIVPSWCIADDPFTAVVQAVKAVCTRPGTQGEQWSVSGDVKGDVGIQLRLLKVAGAGGTLHFSKEEWSGIQRVLAAQQADDNKDYRQCVRELTPKFLDKVSPGKS
jgi:hypothetical protein